MRIVHLVTQDNGGAGRACVRLHKALLEHNVDSIILTQNKTTDTPQIRQIAQTKLQKAFAKIRPFLSQLPLKLYPKRHKDIFSPHLPFFSKKISRRAFDIYSFPEACETASGSHPTASSTGMPPLSSNARKVSRKSTPIGLYYVYSFI